MQNGKNGQHNVKAVKKATEQVQGGEGRQKEQRKNNYIQAGHNPVNPTNKSHTNYRGNFPNISNNFTRYFPNSRTDKITKKGNNDGQGTARNNQLQGQNSSNNSKLDKISEPTRYTIMQSFAARLRYNQAKNEIPIVSNDPIHTTRKGFLAMLLDEDDYYIKLVEIWKYALVGKLSKTIPRMEKVRKSFILQT